MTQQSPFEGHRSHRNQEWLETIDFRMRRKDRNAPGIFCSEKLVEYAAARCVPCRQAETRPTSTHLQGAAARLSRRRSDPWSGERGLYCWKRGPVVHRANRFEFGNTAATSLRTRSARRYKSVQSFWRAKARDTRGDMIFGQGGIRVPEEYMRVAYLEVALKRECRCALSPGKSRARSCPYSPSVVMQDVWQLPPGRWECGPMTALFQAQFRVRFISSIAACAPRR